MSFRYISLVATSVPLLPIMAYQGTKIRKSVPKLPEASGPNGTVKVNSSNESLSMITIGESTIAGVGVETHEEGFTGTLAKALANSTNTNVEWMVYAKSGYTAKMVRERLIPKITDDPVDVIVLGLGGNDAFTFNRPKRWRTHMKLLIDDLKIKQPNAKIFLCNMPPIKEFPAFTPLIKYTIGNLVEILGQEMQDLTKDDDRVAYFNDIITLEQWIEKLDQKPQKSEFFSDGVHPSKLTYQTWANEIAMRIAKTLKF